MNSIPFSLIALFLLGAGIMMFTGCTSTPATITDVITNYQSRISSIDDYSMSVRQTASWGEKDIDILYKQPYQYLLKHRSEQTGRTWTQAIHSLTYTDYDPEARTVDLLVISDPERCFPPIQDLNRLALPVLFSGNYNLSDLESGMINGRMAYRIDAVYTGYGDRLGVGRGGTIRLWIDKEFWLVTRIQAFNASGNWITTFEVKNLTVNTGIPDTAFIVTYPAGTKKVHPYPFCPFSTGASTIDPNMPIIDQGLTEVVYGSPR